MPASWICFHASSQHGAVSNMVRRLAERGFVNYERYRGFTLTPDGRWLNTSRPAIGPRKVKKLELVKPQGFMEADERLVKDHSRCSTFA